MLDWLVPAKKWVESVVKEILVTAPKTWLVLLMAMFWMDSLAMVPLPPPTTMSPLGN